MIITTSEFGVRLEVKRMARKMAMEVLKNACLDIIGVVAAIVFCLLIIVLFVSAIIIGTSAILMMWTAVNKIISHLLQYVTF